MVVHWHGGPLGRISSISKLIAAIHDVLKQERERERESERLRLYMNVMLLGGIMVGIWCLPWTHHFALHALCSFVIRHLAL